MNYLKETLKEKNISTTELAKRTGINRTTISKLCRDKETNNMRSDTAYKLATALNIPVGEFVRNMLNKTNPIKELDLEFQNNLYKEKIRELFDYAQAQELAIKVILETFEEIGKLGWEEK